MVSDSLVESLGFEFNRRRFSVIMRLFTKEQSLIPSSYNPDEIVYSGLENHAEPKLPNLTYLPNLVIPDCRIMLGSTMGHQHTQKQKGDARQFQEIYEFFGYGGMLLRNSSGTRFHVLKPRDKILTGTDDDMTFFNLSESPLITHDMANPSMNSANKDLEESIGTMMFLTFYNGALTININPKYYLEGLMGNAVPRAPIVASRCKLGLSLYKRLADYGDAFADSGIELVVGGNLTPKLQEEFKGPLLTLVVGRNKTLLDSLGFEEK